MIHWAWLILAFAAGEFVGVAATAMCMSAKSAEEKAEKMRKRGG